MATIKREPWHPAEWDEFDASAIQALARGDANDQQQRRALQWIVEKASMVGDQSFVPGQADVVAFIEGRRSVGNQIRKLVNINLVAMRQTERKAK